MHQVLYEDRSVSRSDQKANLRQLVQFLAIRFDLQYALDLYADGAIS